MASSGGRPACYLAEGARLAAMPEPLHLSGFCARRQPQAAVPVGGASQSRGFLLLGRHAGSALQAPGALCLLHGPFALACLPRDHDNLVMKCFLSLVLFSLRRGQAQGQRRARPGVLWAEKQGVTTTC